MSAKLLTASGGGVILDAANTATDKTLTLPALDDTVLTRTTNVTSGTAVASTSGTSIDFTGIPSWVKRITVMFNGVSLNGSSNIQIQLGTSSGVETTGYNSGSWIPSVLTTSTTGLLVSSGYVTSFSLTGTATIALISTNQWVLSSVGSNVANGATSMGGGAKTTAATLDRVRITTVNGTDAFDAGSINILYE